MKNDGGPAFPEFHEVWTQTGLADGSRIRSYHVGHGMTLRDYFAARAPEMPWAPNAFCEMVGIPVPDELMGAAGIEHLMKAEVAWRYYYADAMLAERDRLK